MPVVWYHANGREIGDFQGEKEVDQIGLVREKIVSSEMLWILVTAKGLDVECYLSLREHSLQKIIILFSKRGKGYFHDKDVDQIGLVREKIVSSEMLWIIVTAKGLNVECYL